VDGVSIAAPRHKKAALEAAAENAMLSVRATNALRALLVRAKLPGEARSPRGELSSLVQIADSAQTIE
jgi:hypothetical protein